LTPLPRRASRKDGTFARLMVREAHGVPTACVALRASHTFRGPPGELRSPPIER
jgi:hypothetical protein